MADSVRSIGSLTRVLTRAIMGPLRLELPLLPITSSWTPDHRKFYRTILVEKIPNNVPQRSLDHGLVVWQ